MVFEIYSFASEIHILSQGKKKKKKKKKKTKKEGRKERNTHTSFNIFKIQVK